ncbi:tripartite tricarboxylate transporter TctB family protein [Paracoccus sp. (in: a-proteobacteria)]|uniref:tripartite tricarboxylate transporter TctB family protein n=1 Tax=Paracoccus sp. TaxID=267 RepID=UPI003A8A4F17
MAELRRGRGDVWIGGGLLVLCALVAWRTLHIRQGFSNSVAGPSFVPWLVIGATAILSGVLIRRGLRRGDGVVALPDRGTFYILAGFAVLLLAYAAAFYPVGYIPTTLAAFVLGLWLIGERKLPVLIGFPVVMTAAVYLVFTKLLSVWLP